MMAAVAIVALVSAIAIEVPPTINPFMRDRGIKLGAVSYVVTVILLTCAIAAPLIGAVGLALNAVSRRRVVGRLSARRLLAATALFGVGLAMITQPLPLDGMKHGDQISSGTFVVFYHQYRFLPGRHITPCFEVITRDETRQTYFINKNNYFSNVVFRLNSDRTIVWVAEVPWPTASSQGVLCSLNRITGEFISTPGPFPAGITESGGLPPRPFPPGISKIEGLPPRL
jgi:hypothetical protein